jgi:nucleoside-diphosphate-sugar epimerase
VQAIRKRQLPLVGDAGGIWPFVHVEDAADATINAIEGRGRGVYNVVDDEPAVVADWLPAAAEAVGARAPLHVPRWLGRLFAGEFATVMMTQARGASNAKAKQDLAWAPRHATWREGFATGLGR